MFSSINRPDWRNGAAEHRKTMRTAVAAALLFVIMAQPSIGKEQVDWSRYPEMARDRALPLIVASLRNSLFDAGSMTNFMICYPPVKVKLEDGRPVRWTILLSLNSKNQYGGYAGNQGVAAVFYSDKPVSTFSTGMPLSSKDLSKCDRVPDSEIQRLIGQ